MATGSKKMQDIAFSKILTRKEVVLQIGRRVSTKVNTAGRVPVRVHNIYLSAFRFSFINYSFLFSVRAVVSSQLF